MLEVFRGERLQDWAKVLAEPPSKASRAGLVMWVETCSGRWWRRRGRSGWKARVAEVRSGGVEGIVEWLPVR